MQSAKSKSQLLEQQNAYYVNQYLMTKEMQEESFKSQHDFKNILVGLRAKLQSGVEKKDLHELDKLLGSMEHPVGVCHSGNLIIDSILNYKRQTAEKYHIPVTFDLNIPPQMELDTTTISVILGNALDNAIEACKENENVERHIKVHMQYLNESLFIRIQNPYVHEIRTNAKGEIRTSKTNRQVHGIGLKNIKKIVDDCHGLSNISYDNNLFQIEVVLFNIERAPVSVPEAQASGVYSR
ncbi:ATP-binding protein [Paenibacillus segetis]|uniref:ATP-binding protein n=1 Tax=Paenibacillus segetis TaxID=1325360 RepID=UPI001889269D|nr:ATP-binding protein [Paenibacillus segetis]